MVVIPQKGKKKEKQTHDNIFFPFSKSFKTNHVRYHRKQAITLWVSYYFHFICKKKNLNLKEKRGRLQNKTNENVV